VLSGWLYRTAQLTAANYQRVARRRQRREQEAFMQFTESSPPDFSSHRLGPLLEEAMARLNARDRDALVLRFFENRTVSEVAAALGLGEAAAQKRVNRATARLRHYFTRRGIQVSATALMVAMGATAAHAAPAGLAQTISTVAATHGATASASTLTLMKGALKLMAWTKIKTAIVVGVALVFAGGTTTVVLKKTHFFGPDESVWNAQRLADLPAMVFLRSSKFAAVYPGGYRFGDGNRFRMQAHSLTNLLGAAYGFSPERMIFNTDVPPGLYDCLDTAANPGKALQATLANTFGLVGRVESRDTAVLALRIRQPAGGPGLHPAKHPDGGGGTVAHLASGMQMFSARLGTLAANLEAQLHTPVLDETGLGKQFDLELHWQGRGDLAQVNAALQPQLGLELVPTNVLLEMLVVEKKP
jgi:uncharacterized protein (TIGR03435 family)